jgi:hypothetical protein
MANQSSKDAILVRSLVALSEIYGLSARRFQGWKQGKGPASMRMGLFVGCFALLATSGLASQADAKRRYSVSKSTKSRGLRARGYTAYGSRGTTEGSCPCNGGNVCVGPRGGRYCITSGGNKRYGV